MPTNSKRHAKNLEIIEKDRVYALAEGLELLRTSSKVKFDETVDIAINLGIDPRKSDQAVRGAVSLPHGTGRSRRVIAFVKDPEKQEAAREAGAVEVGEGDLVKRVADGWTDFDVAVAAPDMMGQVGKLGKVLGPQGKMPTPKSGTVTPDVATAVREFTAGKVEFRADAGGTVHGPVGKRSFETGALEENVHAFVKAVVALKPAAARGAYLKKVCLATTMGPGVTVDLGELRTMPNLVNESISAEYNAFFGGDLDALFVQPVGMSVEDVNAFRGMLAESQLRMQVVKGSLARRAMEASGFTALDELFVGPAAAIVADGEDVDAVAITAAKVVAKWRKESGATFPAVKGGVMEGEVLGQGAAAALAKLPGKAELQSILAGQIVGPARLVAGQVVSGGGKIAGAIKSHIEKLEQAG